MRLKDIIAIAVIVASVGSFAVWLIYQELFAKSKGKRVEGDKAE